MVLKPSRCEAGGAGKWEERRQTGPRWVGWRPGAQGSELVGIHPLVGALVLEAHSLHQLICLRGASAGRVIGRGEM